MESSYNFNLVVVDEVTSTNQVLARASLQEYPLNTALLARRQSSGRGRAERSWVSTVGGMYLSCLFLPKHVEGLTLLGALCVVRLCSEELGVAVELRWPNDVYHQGKKLAGVLPQVKFQGQKLERAVLGVGLNVNQDLLEFPQEVRDRATTLSRLLPDRTLEVEALARKYLTILSEELVRFDSEGCSVLSSRCQVFLEGKGQRAGVSKLDGSVREIGLVEGLGPKGELLLAAGKTVDRLGVDERLVLL